MLPWQPLLELLHWCPIFNSSSFKSYKNQAPIDFITTWYHNISSSNGHQRLCLIMLCGYHVGGGEEVDNTLRPRQNGRHFVEDIFKCIFVNENVWISLKISLKFIHKGSINNIPALVQIMDWNRPGDKPLYEPMMVSLPMYICVTRPQWVKECIINSYYNLHAWFPQGSVLYPTTVQVEFLAWEESKIMKNVWEDIYVQPSFIIIKMVISTFPIVIFFCELDTLRH